MGWRKEMDGDRRKEWRILAVQCPDGQVRTMLGVYGDNKGRIYDWYVTGNLGGPRMSSFEGWCQKNNCRVLAVFDPPPFHPTNQEPDHD